VVTAGGTLEAIDPVRYIGNRSSGQMGVALAMAAIDAGADVTLIATPTVTAVPEGPDTVRVETALQMEEAVHAAAVGADALIMAAAVADFRPRDVAVAKIKKQAGVDDVSLSLVKNPDILAGVDESSVLKIGFAAETHDVLANAEAKLHTKGLAMIVANNAARTLGSDSVQATLLFRDGREPVRLEEMPKTAAAERIIEDVARLLRDQAQ
jgi:phosphopantothenoylcysteine decarboxylase/phosphopantothenate--cysteine ligase